MKRALLILAACGGAKAHAPDNHGGEAPAAAPAIGAGMFEAGRSWRYDVSDVDEQRKPVHSTVTCTVREVDPIAQGQKSAIECDAHMPGVFEGVWARTPHGLYYLGDPPGEPFDENDLVLALPPVADSQKQELGEGEITTTIEQRGDAWCVTNDSASEGESSTSVTCYDAEGLRDDHYHDDPDDPSAASPDTGFTRLPR